MDLIALNAHNRNSWRSATSAAVMCFLVAGGILGASLLWPAAQAANSPSIAAMPR